MVAGFCALVAIWVIARGYAAARGTLVSILLIGGCPAAALTASTLAVLMRGPGLRWSLRSGLIVAFLAQAVVVADAYLLLHPSFTSGHYQQAFRHFLANVTKFSEAFAGQHGKVTFFLAYQGIGAVIGILALVGSGLSALAISDSAEREANGTPGFLRRGAAWLLNRVLGGGAAAAWAAFLLAAVSAAMSSGLVYNAFGQPKLELPVVGARTPSLTHLALSHSRKRVIARFSLSEASTVTMRVERFKRGRQRRTLNIVSRRLHAGRPSLSVTIRRDGHVLSRGQFEVQLRARTPDGQRSPSESATFRVK